MFHLNGLFMLIFTELLFKNYSIIKKTDTFEVFYTMLCQTIFLDTYKKLSFLVMIVSVTHVKVSTHVVIICVFWNLVFHFLH